MLSRETLDTIIRTAKMELDPVTNKDYELLAGDILDTTGESLGVNTLKRMFGRVNDDTKPTLKSLNIVARYLGHLDWKNYEESLMHGAVQTFEIDTLGRGHYKHIYVDGLSHGAEVEFRYEPDGKMRLHYIGEFRFRVLFSSNSSLSAGNILVIYSFEEGRMLSARKVSDSGELTGFNIGCLNGGISYLKVE